MHVLMRYALVVLTAIVLAIIGACGFAPDFADGALACGPEGACPSGFTCATDNKCYRPGSGPGPTMDAGDGAPPGALSTLLVTDVSLLEGNDPAAPVEASFVVRLVPASDRTVTVDFTTMDETAKAGSDYTAARGSLTFPPGTTSQTVKVTLGADRDVEPAETFLFLLSNAKDAILGEPKATCTILDDDVPGLVIEDLAVNEGHTGLANAAFMVRLTAPFKVPVTVSYSTVDGTALSTVDYIASSGTLVFNANETTKTVLVPIKGDLLDEPDKTFTVTISNPLGAPILDDRAQGTIKDDDPTPTLSIADVTAAEGNPGSASSMTLTVTLSALSGQEVKVGFATGGGNATTADYSGTSGTLVFAPNEKTKTITIGVNADKVDELNETFEVTLSNPVNATIADGMALGTITNDDLPPTLTIADVALAEGMAGVTTFTFTLQLSGPSGKVIGVNYATADGTATAPADYAATSGAVSFAAGQTTKTFTVDVVGDTVDEGVEGFKVNLSSDPAKVTLQRMQALATILNDDSVEPSITISDVTVTEGSAPSTVNATFTVTRSVGGGSSAVSFDYVTADGSAQASSGDYTALPTTTLTWPANDPSTTKTITVVVNGDNVFEIDETFFVNLTNAVNANIVDSQGKGTITNDEMEPTVSIGGTSDTEGNNGTKQLSFPVTLSGPSSQTVLVNYATSNGTATAGSDYSQTSGTLTFAPGQTSKTVSVSVTGDDVYEASETLAVTLSMPVLTSIAVGMGVANGTIENDEAEPTLSIDDVTSAEGNAGSKTFTFTVTLSGQSGSEVTVNYATADSTATTAGNDYAATSGTLTFAPLQTSKTISVTVNGDNTNEGNETFTVQLSGSVGAGISDAEGLGTIQNDDSPAPSLSISDVTLTEGNAGTSQIFMFTVTLSAASAAEVTVDYQTADGSAVSTSDYTSTSGTLTFAPMQTSKTIMVTVSGDVLSETDETFFVNLTNPGNADIFDGQGKGTIIDDPDPLPTVQIDDVTMNEGNDGLITYTFTVTLSAISGQTVTVGYATADDTATAMEPDADYVPKTGSVMITPGNLTATITVSVKGDMNVEENEQFNVVLSNPAGATLGNVFTGTGVITNDD